VFPNNAFALSGGTGTDADLDTDTDSTLSAADYSIQDGSTFLDGDNVANVEFDAAGRVATLTFNAPLQTSDDGEAEYAVALVAEDVTTGSPEAIEDKQGEQLGSGTTAINGGYTDAALIREAFRDPDLALSTTTGASADTRWAETHLNFTTFEVAEDDTEPTLNEVRVDGASRISLVFSEPMVAYNGEPNPDGGDFSALDLTNYTFRAANDSGEAEDFDEWTADRGDDVTNNTFADVTEAEGAFTFGTGATIEVSTDDPRIIRILATDDDDRFPTVIEGLRVRVDEDVTDPAGNAVDTTNDANFKAVDL
jgi:hypothetical protein